MTDDPSRELLPQRAKDDEDEGWGEQPDDGDADTERLLREVPPHHGT